MLGSAGIEAIGRKRPVALQQREMRLIDDQVQEAGLAADRAVAVLDRDARRRPDREADGAAVAAAVMRDF
jgi:hypothetical protein